MKILNDQIGFIPGMQGWLNIRNIKVEFTTQENKGENHMIISIDVERCSIKVNIHSQHMLLACVKTKTSANIILNGEEVKQSDTEQWQRYLASSQ